MLASLTHNTAHTARRMDPLSLLRDCVAGGKPWRIEAEEVVFGDGAHRVKKEEPTAWRKTGRKGA